MELVIDGYNVIGSRGGLRGDVAAKRDAYVSELVRYARLKGHGITVVFDGFPPGLTASPGRRSTAVQHSSGVRVVYSEHERADDVVVRLAQRLREGGTIVSSDREVRDACRSHGCIVLGARVFDERLADVLTEAGGPPRDVGAEPDKDRDNRDETGSRSSKRGNPRRLSKAERKTRRRLERL